MHFLQLNTENRIQFPADIPLDVPTQMLLQVRDDLFPY